MSASIGYHPLVQKDLNQILTYYESEVGPEVADRFEVRIPTCDRRNPGYSETFLILSKPADLSPVLASLLPSYHS